ncbi:MAG: hypothetical protein KDK38_01910, partial [Leptospiraceae bacterium]|nr:hypothetical protein [Leptospiraceae bacterium]
MQDITREDINGRYRIAAFVDNDPNKIGTRIGPYRIFDGQRIAELVETFTASEIWFTMPGKPEFMTEVLHQLQNFPLQYKMVPRKIQQLLPDIRSLRLEDLIQRPEIRLSTDAVETLINNKRVLITGAAGSIGQ